MSTSDEELPPAITSLKDTPQKTKPAAPRAVAGDTKPESKPTKTAGECRKPGLTGFAMQGPDGTASAGYSNWRKAFTAKAWGEDATEAANMWV